MQQEESKGGRGTGVVGQVARTKREGWAIGRGAARFDEMPEPKVTKTETSFVFVVASSTVPGRSYRVEITPEAIGKKSHRMYNQAWRFDCSCPMGKKHFRCKHVLECLERMSVFDASATAKAACLDADGDVIKARRWLSRASYKTYNCEVAKIRKTLAKTAGAQAESPVASVEDVDATGARNILKSMTTEQVRDLPREVYMQLLSACGKGPKGKDVVVKDEPPPLELSDQEASLYAELGL